MTMTSMEAVLTVALCALATALTRFLPFLIFSEGRPTPRYIRYLGNALPSAIFAMLVVYCLKDVDWLAGWHGAPELIGIAATTITHLLFRGFLLSIAVGTLVYMALVQYVFI